jgi:hypothetical protein
MQQQVSGHATLIQQGHATAIQRGMQQQCHPSVVSSMVIPTMGALSSAKNPVPNYAEAEPQKHAASINITPPPSQEDLKKTGTPIPVTLKTTTSCTTIMFLSTIAANACGANDAITTVSTCNQSL